MAPAFGSIYLNLSLNCSDQSLNIERFLLREDRVLFRIADLFSLRSTYDAITSLNRPIAILV